MASKRFFSVELGRLSTGFDVANQRTIVRVWLLAVTGPAELPVQGDLNAALKEEAAKVQATIEKIFRDSAEEALYEAATAAYAVPGEFTVKLSAAWNVFWNRFPTLVEMAAKKAAQEEANAFIDAFSIGLFEDIVTEPGLFLEATAGKAQAAMYTKVYSLVKDQTAGMGDFGKAVGMYCELMTRYYEDMSLDVRVDVPRPVTQALAEAANAFNTISKDVQDVLDHYKDVEAAVQDFPQLIVHLSDQIEVAATASLALAGTKISNLVCSVCQINSAIAKQFQDAGIRLETLDPSKLAAGLPIPDLKSAIADVTKGLKDSAEAFYKGLGHAITETGQQAVAVLNSLKTQLEAAIKAGSREAVTILTAQIEAQQKVFEAANTQLTDLGNNIANTLPAVTAEFKAGAQQLEKDAAATLAVAAGAKQAVAARIDEIAQEAARAAEAALQAAADAVRSIGHTFHLW